MPYGPAPLPKPVIYLASMGYIYSDSSWFTIVEASYNKTYRVTLGDWSSSESVIAA